MRETFKRAVAAHLRQKGVREPGQEVKRAAGVNPGGETKPAR